MDVALNRILKKSLGAFGYLKSKQGQGSYIVVCSAYYIIFTTLHEQNDVVVQGILNTGTTAEF